MLCPKLFLLLQLRDEKQATCSWQNTGVRVITRTWRWPQCPNRTVRLPHMTPTPEHRRWAPQLAVYRLASKHITTSTPVYLGESLPGAQARSPLLLRHFPVPLLSWGVPLRAPRWQQRQQQWHLARAEDEQPQKLVAGPDGDQYAAAVPADVFRGGDLGDWQQCSTGHGVQKAVHPAATTKPAAGSLQGPAPAPPGKHRFGGGRKTPQLHTPQGQWAPCHPSRYCHCLWAERTPALSLGAARRFWWDKQNPHLQRNVKENKILHHSRMAPWCLKQIMNYDIYTRLHFTWSFIENVCSHKFAF